MRAGALKYRLQLLEPDRVTDIYGAEIIRYVETVVAHAERVSAQDFRSDENGEHFADSRVQFNIRDAHRIEPNWRCKQLGGELYTVPAITPNPDRGFKTLICERVNE